MEKKLNEKVENCLELVREIEKGNDSYDESVDPDWCPYCDMSYHDETDCPACAPWEGYYVPCDENSITFHGYKLEARQERFRKVTDESLKAGFIDFNSKKGKELLRELWMVFRDLFLGQGVAADIIPYEES